MPSPADPPEPPLPAAGRHKHRFGHDTVPASHRGLLDACRGSQSSLTLSGQLRPLPRGMGPPSQYSARFTVAISCTNNLPPRRGHMQPTKEDSNCPLHTSIFSGQHLAGEQHGGLASSTGAMPAALPQSKLSLQAEMKPALITGDLDTYSFIHVMYA